MIRTNLSTRPFYNTRLVRGALVAIAVVVAGLTVFNGFELWRLRQANREQGELVTRNETEARDMRDKALAVQRSLNRARLAKVDAEARQANELIARRAFSWTELLNQFQATLPPSVRITSVRPQVDDQGQMLVAITVRSRRQEDLDTFIGALEDSGVFRDVLPRTDSAMEDGSLLSVLQAYYGTAPATLEESPSAAKQPPLAAKQPPVASEPGVSEPVSRSAASVVAGGRP